MQSAFLYYLWYCGCLMQATTIQYISGYGMLQLVISQVPELLMILSIGGDIFLQSLGLDIE